MALHSGDGTAEAAKEKIADTCGGDPNCGKSETEEHVIPPAEDSVSD